MCRCARGAGPFGLLTLLEERCGGVFEDIDAGDSRPRTAAFMAGYKGLPRGSRWTHSTPHRRTIAPGARLS